MENTTQFPHSYYPPTIHLPHFIPNETPVFTLISQFGVLWAAVIVAAWLTIRRVRPTASRSDQLAFTWMCLTGCIHLFFESVFVREHLSLASSQTLFGQLWKEYSLSDSRYLTSDIFLVCMEAVTAFLWGPLCFCIAYTIATQHPVRYALQILVSTGQIYGDVLYFGTSLLAPGEAVCRPEGYYFWFYYFFFNFVWMVIPGYYLGQGIGEVKRAFWRLSVLGEDRKGR